MTIAGLAIPPIAIAAIGAVAFLVLMFCLPRVPSASRRRHARKQASAARALATIGKLDPRANPGRLFAYLRKVDPFVFEEMILTELEARNHAIVRNRRYTGDGGSDGGFTLNGRKWLLQAKRYSRHINAADVSAFDQLCSVQGVRGLFVHTGRTGGKARDVERGTPYVRIISGKDLVALFAGDRIPLV